MIQPIVMKTAVRASEIYVKNREAGNIAIRPVNQLFDPEKGMFFIGSFH